jgi:hypothetical protein
MSPDGERAKLLQYLFQRVAVHDVLYLIVSMILDCRIVILSQSCETLGMIAFGALAAVHPLTWPATFIPILPLSLAGALEAPFAFLVGLNGRSADLLFSMSVERYFVLNVDGKYAANVGTADFPAEILALVDDRAEKIHALFRSYAPAFPYVRLKRKLAKFIVLVLARAYDERPERRALLAAFARFKAGNEESFPVQMSQTQFVFELMGSIDGPGMSTEVLQALWPKDPIPMQPMTGGGGSSPGSRAGARHVPFDRRTRRMVGLAIDAAKKVTIEEEEPVSEGFHTVVYPMFEEAAPEP